MKRRPKKSQGGKRTREGKPIAAKEPRWWGEKEGRVGRRRYLKTVSDERITKEEDQFGGGAVGKKRQEV